MTRADFAQLCGVTSSAITQACAQGSALYHAVRGKRIDSAHPDALAYCADQLSKPSAKPLKGWGARNEAKKAAVPVSRPVPASMLPFLDRTLGSLIEEYGSDVAFLDWLKAVKTMEDITDKRVRNASAEGLLVSRVAVQSGVLDVFEAAHRKILTDGSKTLARRVPSLASAGRSTEEIEMYVSDTLGSFVRAAKAKSARVLQNL